MIKELEKLKEGSEKRIAEIRSETQKLKQGLNNLDRELIQRQGQLIAYKQMIEICRAEEAGKADE